MELYYKIINYKNKKIVDYNNFYLSNYLQYGGNKKYRIKLSDIFDKEITFKEIYKDKKNRKILLTNQEYIKNNIKYHNCISIIIHSNEKIAEIENIQVSDHQCINLDDFGLKTSGKFYLITTIKMLKKYKEKFNINKIILDDIATVKCNDEEFPLSSFLLLTKGYTFYGKYGFKYSKNKYNDLLNKYQNYLQKLKVKDINFNNILKLNKDEELNKQIKKIVKNNKEMKFIDLLSNIFKRENMLNDNICKLYFSIYNSLIIFYQEKLGENFIKLFMTNLKMEMIL